MRFDYYGTGDSAGMACEADLGQWQSDVNTSMIEFKDISGISKVSLVGLRLGAMLAATAPVQSHRVRKLVLWDPVVTGASYIENLRKLHASSLDRLSPLHPGRAPGEFVGMEELIGFRFSDNLIAEIEAVNLLNISEFSASEIYLFVSEQQQEYEQLREHLQSLGLLKSYHITSRSGEWNNMREFDKALIASELLSAISSELTN